jgi:hypothetical protein
VKANVIFFDNRPAAKEPQTREVWYYDYRTNVHHTLKKIAMTINLTTRKCLGYRSPVEAYLSELGRDVQIRFA